MSLDKSTLLILMVTFLNANLLFAQQVRKSYESYNQGINFKGEVIDYSKVNENYLFSENVNLILHADTNEKIKVEHNQHRAPEHPYFTISDNNTASIWNTSDLEGNENALLMATFILDEKLPSIIPPSKNTFNFDLDTLDSLNGVERVKNLKRRAEELGVKSEFILIVALDGTAILCHSPNDIKPRPIEITHEVIIRNEKIHELFQPIARLTLTKSSLWDFTALERYNWTISFLSENKKIAVFQDNKLTFFDLETERKEIAEKLWGEAP